MCFVICISLFYAGLGFIIFSKSSCLPILFVICILFLNLYVYFICFWLQKKKCMCFVSLLSDFQSNIYTHDAVHVAQMIDTRARYPSHILSFISKVSLCSVISWYFDIMKKLSLIITFWWMQCAIDFFHGTCIHVPVGVVKSLNEFPSKWPMALREYLRWNKNYIIDIWIKSIRGLFILHCYTKSSNSYFIK